MKHPATLLLFCLLALCACSRDYETVENQTEDGQRERYQRRKRDAAKHGRYQRFYPDNSVAEEAHYANDTLDGERLLYFPDGSRDIVENYRGGVFHGKYKKYYPHGQVEIEQEYIDGAMQGESRRYYPDGQLAEVVQIRDNEENGPFKEYHENGQLKTEGTYLDGPFEQGELKEYDTTGALVRTSQCDRGRCRTVENNNDRE